MHASARRSSLFAPERTCLPALAAGRWLRKAFRTPRTRVPGSAGESTSGHRPACGGPRGGGVWGGGPPRCRARTLLPKRRRGTSHACASYERVCIHCTSSGMPHASSPAPLMGRAVLASEASWARAHKPNLFLRAPVPATRWDSVRVDSRALAAIATPRAIAAAGCDSPPTLLHERFVCP
jgi:hypothetical protein